MTDREYHCIMKTMEYLHEKLSPRKDCQTACELIKSTFPKEIYCFH